MQTVLDVPTTSTATVSQADAQRVASEYVTRHIDSALLVSDRASYRRTNDTWLLLIRSTHGALHPIEVETQTGKVVPLTEAQIRLVRERAAIAEARSRNVLPADAHGYILAEYARRRASRYLDAQLSMYFSAIDPVFVPGDPAHWQVTIVFKMYDIGPITLGIMEVDARTGEPVPLTDEELTQIRERTSAIIRHQTSAPATG
jgi:hypothetical protein